MYVQQVRTCQLMYDFPSVSRSGPRTEGHHIGEPQWEEDRDGTEVGQPSWEQNGSRMYFLGFCLFPHHNWFKQYLLVFQQFSSWSEMTAMTIKYQHCFWYMLHTPIIAKPQENDNTYIQVLLIIDLKLFDIVFRNRQICSTNGGS